MEQVNKKRNVNFIESVLLIITYAAIFVWAKGRFSTGMAILLCAFVTAFYGIVVLRHSWDDIFGYILKTYSMGMPAILVLMMVGLISASWLSAGTIPFLIVYGFKILNPSIFLVAAFFVTGIVAVATGSSWTVCSTFGIALMGVAKGMGIPPGVAGAAVVSGCWLGDKWSPLSDSTNLGAAVTGEDVVKVFKHMFPTSGISAIGAALIFSIVGMKYSSGSLDTATIDMFIDGITSAYNINVLLLIPVVLVIVLAAKGKPVIPVLICGVVAGVAIAVIVQGQSLPNMINVLYNGYSTDLGIPELDKLISGGGLVSMMGVTLIIFCALAFSGAVEAIGVMDAMIARLDSVVSKPGPLVATSFITTVVATFIGGSAYVGMILNGGMYKTAYEKAGLSNINLSRTILEGSGYTGALTPWCASNVLIVATLGVTWADFLPYLYPFWLTGILVMIYAFTGKFTLSLDVEDVNSKTI